jgi:hypothetical protein
MKFILIIFKKIVSTSQIAHYISATKINRLTLFRETIAVYCEKSTKYINTQIGQNAEFLTL